MVPGYLSGARPPMALTRSMDQDDLQRLFPFPRIAGKPFSASLFSYSVTNRMAGLSTFHTGIFPSKLSCYSSYEQQASFSCSPNSFTGLYCIAFPELLLTWRLLDRCLHIFHMCFSFLLPICLGPVSRFKLAKLSFDISRSRSFVILLIGSGFCQQN